MSVGAPYGQGELRERFDAIVIGSGIGGLGCAAGLARYGRKKVLVLERHYRIGGYTHTFTRPGYEWDVGVHYLGQLGRGERIRALFDRLTDGSLRWAPLPAVYDRIVLGERSYELAAGAEAFVETLGRSFPGERAALERYLELCRAVMSATETYFLDRALPERPERDRPLLRPRLAAWAPRTTREVLRELTRNEELISVLTGQWGNYGLPPSRSSFASHAGMVAHYLEGGWYPAGGASSIARAFAPVIEQAGGRLCHSIEVERVLVERGRAVGVLLADGTPLRAPLVISDAGAANTYRRLLAAEQLPPGLTAALKQVEPSGSSACLYLGFEHTDAELGLTGTNLWLYPDGQHDQNLARFTADPSAPLPMVYASFPSAKDPAWSARHPGRATVCVIIPFGWDRVGKWQHTGWKKRGGEYEALKASLTERILEVLLRALPQLKGKIAVAELSTPLTLRHFGGHPHGELYGLEPSPQRFQLPLRARSPVPGLFLTGADLATAGVAGALVGGALTVGAIEGMAVLGELMRRDPS